MTDHTPLVAGSAGLAGSVTSATTYPIDRRVAARTALRDRHSHKLARLMDEREDLKGVHALADFVHDALRWTA